MHRVALLPGWRVVALEGRPGDATPWPTGPAAAVLVGWVIPEVYLPGEGKALRLTRSSRRPASLLITALRLALISEDYSSLVNVISTLRLACCARR
jgi:hypothetical protein